MAENPSSIEHEEKNYSLQEDVVYLEQMLSDSRTECDDIGQKYTMLNQKMNELMKFHSEGSESEDLDQDKVLQQNEFINHDEGFERQKHIISYYQKVQKQQYSVIDQLNHRVEEYRTNCARLEAALTKYSENQETLQDLSDFTAQNGNSLDKDVLVLRLEQEKNRCQGLNQINNLLREQLETATEVNRALTTDIEHLTDEWQRTRKELEAKETEWQQEGQSFTVFLTKEHHRLSWLWRYALQFRHEYAKLKTATERDLSAMKSQLENASHVLSNVCGQLGSQNLTSQVADTTGLASKIKQLEDEIFNLQLKSGSEKAALSLQIKELVNVTERQKLIIDEKERNNNTLNKGIDTLDGKPFSGTADSDEVSRSAEVNRCCQALKDVAEIVLEDSKHKSWFGVKIRNLSPVRKYLFTNTPHSVRVLCQNHEFIDGTTSAVKTALQNRSRQAQELNAKVISYEERINAQKRAVGNLEEEKKRLNQDNERLKIQLKEAKAKVQDFVKDTRSIQSTIDVTGTQNSWLEQMRKTLNDQIDSLNTENDRLNQVQTSLYQKVDQLQQENDKFKLSEQTALHEVDRSHKKISMLEDHLKETEKQCQAMQQKLQTLSLDRELLEQEREELTNNMKKLEKQRADLDTQLANAQTEGEVLKNKMISLETENESLVQEKEELNKSFLEITAETELAKSAYLKEKMEYDQERKNSKAQMDSLQTRGLELETEIEKAKNNLKNVEENKSNIEEEKKRLQLENNNLSNQATKLTSQTKMLEEEMEQISNELQYLKDTCDRLTRDKENLARMKGELAVRAESAENELSQVKDVAEALKREKEELEKALYASQQLLSALQDQKQEIEDDLDNEKNRIGFIQRQLSDLKKQRETDLETFARDKDSLNKKVQQNEEEYRTVLQREKQQHVSEMDLVSQEKESQRVRFEIVQSELTQQMQDQQEELIFKHAQDIAEFKKQMILHEQELQDRLYMSLNAKTNMHSEDQCDTKISSLQELTKTLEQKLEESRQEFTNVEREMSTVVEEYKQTIETLEMEKTDLVKEKTSSGVHHETAIKTLEDQIAVLKEEKEEGLKTVHQLHILVEETKVEKSQLERRIENYLLSTEDGKSKIQELDQQIMLLKQKLSNEKSVSEMSKKSFEDLKERLKKYQKDNTELRSILHENKQRTDALESVNVYGKGESEELRKVLGEVEKSRLEVKREVQLLRKKVGVLEAKNDSKDRELDEFRILLSREEDIETELKNEIMKLKQKLMEAEASQETSSKEVGLLRRKFSDAEHKLKVLKEEHNIVLHETLSGEQSFVANRVSLEKSLAEANEEAQRLRVKFSVSDGKVAALENKIAKLEGSKRNAENKLHSLNLSLRSTLGLGPDSGFQTSSSHLFMTPLSSRRESPIKLSGSTPGSRSRELVSFRDHSILRDSPMSQSATASATELDIDLVKSALQDFAQKFYHTEKERDDLRSEVMTFQRQLEQLTDSHSNTLTELQKVRQEMDFTFEEKKDISAQMTALKQKEHSLEDCIQSLERERKQLSEKNESLLQSITTLELEKSNFQAKILELRKFEVQMKQERDSLLEARATVETNLLKAEAHIQELEMEKQELQELVTEKETEIETMEHKVQQLTLSLQETEHNNEIQLSTIDHLSSLIDKHKLNERAFIEKVTILEKSLSEMSINIQSFTRELNQLRGKHSACEIEKSSLQNTIENLRSTISELKRSNESLRDRIQNTTGDLKNAELRKAELEGQLQGYETVISYNEGLGKGTDERLRNVENEKYLLEEQLARMKMAVTQTDSLRLEAEKQKHRAEKEKTQLQKVYEKLQKEHSYTEALANRSVLERSTLGKSLSKMEVENQMLNSKIQTLKAKLAESEKRHEERLKELEFKQKLNTDSEIQRLHSSREQLKQLLDVQDRHNKHVVMSLETQVSRLQEQLRHNHNFLSIRSVSALNLPTVSNDSLNETLDRNQRQTSCKSAGAKSVKEFTSTLTRSAPPMNTKPTSSSSAAFTRMTSTPKAKKRLENLFKS